MDEFAYDRTDIHLRYAKARQLPERTIKLWLDTIADYIPRDDIKTILDIGCGTGRFTRGLSNRFGAEVYGIDPALKMLRVARQDSRSDKIHFIKASANAIPLGTGAADLVFLSMAYHHFQNKERAIGEFKRMLRAGGYLCIRTSTIENMDSYVWLRFFTAARQIELNRTPTRQNLIDSVLAGGFEIAGQTTVRQLFADNLDEYCTKIGFRGLSSLQMVTDKDFREGLAQLKQHCSEQSDQKPVFEEIGLFVFRAA
jgi:ubiquinone/menaquinone biosynthesis C-methylase UbiE